MRFKMSHKPTGHIGKVLLIYERISYVFLGVNNALFRPRLKTRASIRHTSLPVNKNFTLLYFDYRYFFANFKLATGHHLKIYSMLQKPVITLAVADSQPIYLSSLASMLEGSSYFNVSVKASSAAGLVKALDEIEIMPGIFILDSMLVLDGIDLPETLKKRWPQLKTLLLCAHDVEDELLRFIKQGIKGFLPKNSTPDALSKALQDICQNGFYYSADVSEQLVRVLNNSITKYPHFSTAELEVLRYCGGEHTYTQIADILHITKRAVEGYRDSIFRKAGVHTRQELVIFGIKYGAIKLKTTHPKPRLSSRLLTN